MPDEIAATPLGAAMRFMLAKLRENGPVNTVELAARLARPEMVPRFERARNAVQEELGAFRVSGYRVPSAKVGFIDLRDEKGRDQAIGVAVVADRIRALTTGARPPGFSYRAASLADADALAALELATPLVTGDVETVYDRSRDYFEAERLAGGELVLVERAGEIVGLFGSVTHSIRVNGDTFQGVCQHRARVHPGVQGRGVYGLLNLALFEAAAGRPGDHTWYAFIAVDNDASLDAGPGRDPRSRRPLWEARCERLVIDTAGASSRSIGRLARESDAGALVELLNDAHGAEELFVPYTVETLRARLAREPSSYAWPNFLVSERACVGVWTPRMGVIRRAGGVETRTVRAFVLDYGCTAGGVGELLALVNNWRARL
ncbi:MAG TPA: hypothetical protein VGF50_00575, partial [Caulobacteraceae bacterium]